MSLLAPLGLLGLMGIIALIIIYIIKPNYQSKFITSTFVWRLSLKYKKKKIPLSTLRNILLFICQVAILTGAAFILARPIVGSDEPQEAADIILVIDASASMQTETRQETRLTRAANAALADARVAFENGKKVSVILASETSRFLVQEATADNAELVYNALSDIVRFPEEYYTFGSADIKGAMAIAEQITAVKEDTAVTLYTDTTYLDTGKVNVYNVADTSEWNAAILDVRATVVENLYRVEIDVACYGQDTRLAVSCEFINIDGKGDNLLMDMDAYCSGDEVTTIVLGYITEDMSEEEAEWIDEEIFVAEFEQIYVSLTANDSFDQDNSFYLFGGKKPTVKIQYYSTAPTTYWRTALDILAAAQQDRVNIEVTEVGTKTGETQVATEGFDIYIFEHTAPATLPDDGIVIYCDPSKLPSEAGVRFGSKMQAEGEIFLSAGENHPITTNMAADKISVTQFTSIVGYDGYSVLLECQNYPLLLVKDDVDQKIVLMPFSVQYSNIVALPEFILLFNNIVNHFFPLTISEDYVYEPGDKVALNARAEELEVVGPATNLLLNELPTEIVVKNPGVYTTMQIPISGETVIENFYVKIPSVESDICYEEDKLTTPYFFEVSEENHLDLLFYFALAVVALLFIEWWLKSREQI